MNIDEKREVIQIGTRQAAIDAYGVDEISLYLQRQVIDLATACALLTSPVKAERESGKAMVRAWKAAGVSHAKDSAVE